MTTLYIACKSRGKIIIFHLPVGPLILDENGAQAARGKVSFILFPVPPTTIAGSGGDVFISRHRLDTEKSVHLVTDVEFAILLRPKYDIVHFTRVNWLTAHTISEHNVATYSKLMFQNLSCVDNQHFLKKIV